MSLKYIFALITLTLFSIASKAQTCAKTPTTVDNVLLPLLGPVSPDTAKAHPWIVGTINRSECCKTDAPQLGCPHSAKEFDTLETPESGFNEKFKMLAGEYPPPDFIKNGDPNAPIDLSKMPKLKGVYLSSLVFRGDFYGKVMARLLKAQADQGALVNIVTTDYMLLDKDRKMLDDLTACSPNIKTDKFKYNNPNGVISKATSIITDKYRDMHIKLFVTLSDKNEKDNAVIFGGRNIHDGFLYDKLPDHSRFPDMVQYGPGKDDDFVHWNDFEAKITSKEIAESTAAHLQRFISRDKPTQKMQPFSTDKNCTPSLVTGKTFQHFISVPYTDDHELEKQYIKMIDSAKSSIKISSPYLRPPQTILDALDRAAKRGVDVQIQTRVVLKGDTQAELYEEVNKESINALYKTAKIYEWKEDSILHSKFLLVDGERAMMGSVNLSRRSFIQDAENVYLINDASVVNKMTKIFDSYVKKSAQITKPLPRKIIPSLKIKLLENQF